ncbi:MAG: nitroreductase family protein [Firmicutes bacterium]|jgi:nitroreductase/NAD-dependent dihydropyrimidine dehydrogenase PreA subunit|nr:nitroreductase family protein [Bacillota bacterium]
MKEQVIIDQEKCIGCGLCVKDCASRVIIMEDKKACISSQACIKCGHCIAICPVNAFEITDLDADEIKDLSGLDIQLAPDKLHNVFRSMRTIRSFTNQAIPKEVITSIIDAGRYSSTSTNQQGVRYIVVQNDINLIEDMILGRLETFKKISTFVSKVRKLKYDLSKYDLSRGFVFRNAPLLLIAVSSHEVDGALASRNMELMSRAHGLGGLHCGIFTIIGNRTKKVKQELGLSKKEKFVACLALGYPAVKYQRTVPRRQAIVDWR